MSDAPRSRRGDHGFALVHGAGLDTWVWEALTPRLDVPTLTPSFPEREATQSVRNELRLGDYVEYVARQIEEWDVPAVVLVGHSIGGTICIDVASRLSTRVVGFVGLSAAIPTQGRSFLSCFPRRQQLAQWIIMRIAGTKPPEGVIRQSLCSGLSDAQADRLVEHFTPESRRLYTDAVEVAVPDVPSRFVKTISDEAVPPARQDEMIGNVRTEDVTEIDAGHMAMLSHPREVATALRGFGSSSTR